MGKSTTSSTRTRRGGSCLKNIYETFLIYRTCMRRAPAKPVRACTLREWCLVSHVTFEAPLHTSQLTVFALHSPHFTLHSSHCTLSSQRFTSHCTLKTPHFTLHTALFTPFLTALFTLQTSHFTLRSSCPTLHTALFTPHTSSRLSSSHLIPAQTCYVLLGYFMSSERSSNLLMDLLSTSASLSVTHVDSSTGVDHKIFTILRTLMASVDALHQIATASVNMV